jgi:hypothetical protein
MIGLQCKISEIGLEIDNLNFEWSAVLGIVGQAQTKRHRWHRTANLSTTPPRHVAASEVTGRTATHPTAPATATTHPTATTATTTTATHSAAHATTHPSAAATIATVAIALVTRLTTSPICRSGNDAARERNGRYEPAVEKRACALHRDGARRGLARGFAIVTTAPLGPAFTAGPKGSQR